MITFCWKFLVLILYVFCWAMITKDPLFQSSIGNLISGSSWWSWVIITVQKRINRKEIRSFFREPIPISNIISGTIKIKISVLVHCFDEFMTYFALLRSIINPFLSYFCNLPVKYVVSSNINIFLIMTFWAFVSNPIN